MDPVERLVHEHDELTQLLSRLGELVGAFDETAEVSSEQSSQLTEVATELHDAMLSHFAAEEDLVFPFLTRHVMELSDRIAVTDNDPTAETPILEVERSRFAAAQCGDDRAGSGARARWRDESSSHDGGAPLN